MVAEFLQGMVAMGFAVAGLLFLRFWRRTGDALFATFATSFWLLALAQTLVTLATVPREAQSWIYLIRLAAFVLLIAGIVAKNTSSNNDGSE